MNEEHNIRGKVRKLKSNQRSLFVVLWVTITFGSFQTINAQQKPDWLLNYPADPLYYYGVGGINKAKNDTEFQSKAREIALGELISQIEVNVASTTNTSEMEVNGEYENSFSQLIQLQAQKTIEDFEVVDSWQNEEEFWIMIRLSKQKYQQRLQEKMDLAQSQALTALRDGDSAFEAGNFGTALSSYTRALGDISPYIDRLPEITYGDKTATLFSVLRSNVQQVINQLQVSSTDGPEEVRIGKSGEQPFLLTVENQEGAPVAGIPFQFQFSRGEGDLDQFSVTGQNGEARSLLSKLVADDKLQIISATLHLNSFLPEEVRNEFMNNLFGSFNALSARYVIKAQGIPVYLEYAEQFLGEEKTTNYIQPVLKQFFNQENYVFTDAMNAAELYIELETSAREGSETYGIYSAFVDYKITVTSLLSGEEVATYSVADVKGISDSYEKAAAKAYEVGVDSLKANIITKLISQIEK
jgi:hypothetical protein